MPGVKTSTSFYRRGVPNTFTDFGKLAAGNYTIFQPTNVSFHKSISNIISISR